MTNPLLKLFGQSPFKPLQQHMRVVTTCANFVPDMFQALCDGDDAKVVEMRQKIHETENAADTIKNELRSHLPRSLFMPVDRRDLLEILDLQDSIADAAQDIAGTLYIRKMNIPEDMQAPLMALTRRCVDACNQLAKIVEELDELIETGFRGPESEAVLRMIDELSEIETDTDVKATELFRNLFAHEAAMDPVSVIIWMRLIHWISDLANFAERAGNRHRLLLAR